MVVQPRAVTEQEFAAFTTQVAAAFGYNGTLPLDGERRLTELERTRAVFEGDEPIATSESLGFQLTVPGPRPIPVAAIAKVGVATAHRRQGVLRAMMAALLDDADARREAVSILYASEAPIYGRFGYGPATSQTTITVDSQLAVRRDRADLRSCQRLANAGAVAQLAPLFDAAAERTVGAVNRSRAWWEELVGVRRSYRGGGNPFVVAHRGDGGALDGYVLYRVLHPGGGVGPGVVALDELVTLNDEAAHALWSYCLSVDLTTSVVATARPVDDPLPWWLVDRRHAVFSDLRDALWVRLVDLGAALEARSYRTADVVGLDVVDPFRPRNAGRWELRTAADGTARCRRVDAGGAGGERPADVRVEVGALGSVYLGGVSWHTLQRAGLVAAPDPSVLDRLDALFGGSGAPWCAMHF
ncbi:MAG: GNAT family N-acetyltransferase [Acidimicrobiia bacterium]|nr:GNAT family N-acetyltransferase [Acidimicrobiia bacterium]